MIRTHGTGPPLQHTDRGGGAVVVGSSGSDSGLKVVTGSSSPGKISKSSESWYTRSSLTSSENAEELLRMEEDALMENMRRLGGGRADGFVERQGLQQRQQAFGGEQYGMTRPVQVAEAQFYGYRGNKEEDSRRSSSTDSQNVSYGSHRRDHYEAALGTGGSRGLRARFQAWKMQRKTVQPTDTVNSMNRPLQPKPAHYTIDTSATSSMTSVTGYGCAYDPTGGADASHAYHHAHKEYIDLEVPIARYGTLGITVIGQTTPDGQDVGIYCGGICQNSASASLGNLIEVGDRIVMVDGEDLRCMENDAAVEVLQTRVNLCLAPGGRKGSISLGLAKYIDRPEIDYFTQEEESISHFDPDETQIAAMNPAQPINPAEWVKNHSEFYSTPNLHDGHQIGHHRMSPSRQLSHTHKKLYHDFTSDSSSFISSTEQESSYDTLLYDPQVQAHKKLLPSLSIQTSMRQMIKTAASFNSGLKIRNRQWLRLVIYDAFVGADLVDWLHEHVTGLEDRRDAKQYAATLFQGGLIKATIQARPDKFSEKSYYKF